MIGCLLNIATFNVRGINDIRKQEDLCCDFDRYKIDIACLQETKIKDGVDVNIGNCRLLTFKTECVHYGLGFVWSKSWDNSIHRVWRVNDRIAVLQLISSEQRIITIINVYAPTTARVAHDQTEIENLYEELNTLVAQFKSKTSLILCGDFNAKVGVRNQETCLGRYSRGIRNNSGQCLVDFCDSHGLYIANSSFKHRACHITTWTGRWKDTQTGKIVPIYNQIDYIICDAKYKKFLQNARAYSGTSTYSDHRPVIAAFRIEWHRVWRRKNTEPPKRKLWVSKVVNDKETQNAYNDALQRGINSLKEQTRGDIPWGELKTVVYHAAESTIGFQEKSPRNDYITVDPHISELSEAQKKLRLKIESCRDEQKRQELKQERNRILHDIKKKVQEKRNQELDEKAREINSLPDHAQMFKAINTLHRKRYENTKVLDGEQKFVTDPNTIHEVIGKHFKSKFRNETTEDIEPFQGEPRSLKTPIDKQEVTDALKRLNNNKACGEDNIPGELLKYGANVLAEILTSIFNNIFKKHEELDINGGIIIALQKPGKPKGPVKNLRPITLLNTVRKVLSLIVLKRAKSAVNEYLDLSQSGFREGRSTSDIVWTHKWLISKALSDDSEIYITGIDMSSAFDTISRQKLLHILSNIVNEDEHRIIRFLLSNTKLDVKIKGSTSAAPFQANIGTPQGDSLSPVLFVVYLEHALRELRQQTQTGFPNELAYADDVDFVSTTQFRDIDEVEQELAKVNLLVNKDKTEHTIIKRSDNEHWRKIKKVGSLLGDKEDISRRKQLASAALCKLSAIWKRSENIKQHIRLNIYRALVKSILLYNSGTWALTKDEERKLDSFHRKQLRIVLGIRYPTIISNKSLYEKTKEIPLSLTVLENRWRLFGHILRLDQNAPCNKAMISYFKEQSKKRRGRPRTTIVTTLRRDLKRETSHLGLNTSEDLEKLRDTAQNRDLWKSLTSALYRAAQAERSMDFSADGP